MGMGTSIRAALACALAGMALLVAAPPAAAQDIQPDSKGPATVKLGSDLATMQLPKGYLYFGAEKTKKIMEMLGNRSDGQEIGSVWPESEDEKFGILLEYDDSGYVEDKDADKIDADKILESYQEGTEAANEERKERGLPAIHVTGWEEKPSYDSKRHVVVWSLQGKNDQSGPFVNYFTRVLCRTGVLSVNLMCSNEELPKVKPKSQALVKTIAFNPGKRYEDYKQGDKISSGGLVALIAGGALLAKKTGVLAFLAVMFKPLLLLLKAGGAKLIAVVAALFMGLLSKLKRNQ